MEKFTCTDMAYIYRMLSGIKKPSARVKEMIEKLETHMHRAIMGMKHFGPMDP